MRKSMFVFDPSVDPAGAASLCREAGVESLMLHPGFFKDGRFIDAIRSAGLKVWLNLPVFFDEEYLEERPEAYAVTNRGNRAERSWLRMACPSRGELLERKRAQLEDLLRRFGPETLSYDFIRFFVFWEEADLDGAPGAIEHGCYCPACRSAFAAFAGESLRMADGAVERGQRGALAAWKRSVIEGAAGALNEAAGKAAPGVPRHIKTIPWKKADLDGALGWIAGQDHAALGRMSDGLIPMAFTQILGRDPAWKKALLDHVEAESGKPVMSYAQFKPLIRPTGISVEDLDREIAAAIAEERAGLVYFHYEQIADDPDKREILKKYRDR